MVRLIETREKLRAFLMILLFKIATKRYFNLFLLGQGGKKSTSSKMINLMLLVSPAFLLAHCIVSVGYQYFGNQFYIFIFEIEDNFQMFQIKSVFRLIFSLKCLIQVIC